MSTSGLHTANYRPDIDGLRAVAVLAVVGYHFFPEFIPGGFVGVDIFFVISGFLISGIILDDLAENRFSFLQFYGRRIRRLFPALILVLAFTLTIGYLLLFPEEYQALGKHTAGGAGFISNILYWQESGYFDADAASKPLQHLWSLGIEEQFYIFFPCILVLLWKKGFRAGLVLTALLAASLEYNFYLEMRDRTADFYSPLTRFWELLIGALLAYIIRTPADSWLRRLFSFLNTFLKRRMYGEIQPHTAVSPLKNFFAVTGFIMLAFSLVAFRTPPVWPGHLALFPSLGTALILVAGTGNVFNWFILCNRIAVAIGLLSYPLYLWHWPIITYLHILGGGLPDYPIRAAAALIALILAYLTYKLLEAPFRFGLRFRALKTFTLIFFMLVALLAGLVVYSQNGLPWRPIKSPEYETAPLRNEPCFAYTGLLPPTNAKRAEYCLFSGGHGPSTVALIGDSHAWSAYTGIEKFNTHLGLNTLLMGSAWAMRNNEINKNEFLDIIKRSEVKAVFVFLFSSNVTSHSSQIQSVIDTLNGAEKDVFFVMDWPMLPRGGTSYVRRPYSDFFGDVEIRQLELSRDKFLAQAQEYLQVLRSIKNATIIDGTWDAFCSDGVCQVFSKAGQLLYYDQHHLTNIGSERLAEKVLAPYLREIAVAQ